MISAAAISELHELAARYPEWDPWLRVMEELLSEAADARWDAFVPAPTAAAAGAPLLANAAVVVDARLLRDWTGRFLARAVNSGAPKLAGLKNAHHAVANSIALFQSSLLQDRKRLGEIAAQQAIDPEAFEAVALLIAVPFLHACNRRWGGRKADSWRAGFCPVCGAWAALGETRGIDRSRYLRCSRCGGEWQASCLCCPYCGTTDHEKLVTLVSEREAAGPVVEACKHCLGYVKTFTTLQAAPPAKLIIDDLATVALDVAALEQGFRRPAGAAYELQAKITEKTIPSRRFFGRRSE